MQLQKDTNPSLGVIMPKQFYAESRATETHSDRNISHAVFTQAMLWMHLDTCAAIYLIN